MLFVLCYVAFSILRLVNSLSCIDDDGKEVDWFVGYKLPSSFDVVFINPDQRNWKVSSKPINSGGMMKKTYDAMYSLIGEPDAVFGMYNDEIPKINNFTVDERDNSWWGHMKGAFAFDNSDTGFWVIHSIPKLSSSNTSYLYPTNGRTYGQHLLCITLKKSVLKSLVTQLAISRPLFQSAYISSSVKSKFPDLAKLLQNKKVVTSTQSKVIDLQSADGTFQMKHFSKSIDFGKDLYSDFVAPTLKQSLATETWQHDGGMPSDCQHKYTVTNIKSIYIDASQTEITNSHDHAKWAVTVPSRKKKTTEEKADGIDDSANWICLGDINRQPHQKERGGGTMCIHDKQLWQSFYKLIRSIEACPRSYFHRLLTPFWSLIEIIQVYA
ncbi:unnamed protein product [Trichobilharzia szidati]|nr:unnamed protein product [Trichobilharzia szidati]